MANIYFWQGLSFHTDIKKMISMMLFKKKSKLNLTNSIFITVSLHEINDFGFFVGNHITIYCITRVVHDLEIYYTTTMRFKLLFFYQ